MAFHVSGYWSKSFLTNFDNTFIIREPVAALNSQYKILTDFTLEESGYPLLKDLFYAVADIHGFAPILIDASDFTENPYWIMKSYCKSLSLPFIESSLIWEKRKPSEFDLWLPWHASIIDSTCIHPLPADKVNPSSAHVQRMAEQVLPIYEDLKQYRLSPALKSDLKSTCR